ncbi:MAG: ABC transporter ATP-binding protein [Caldilineaceae bacterium]|nr:ABC transporter ATP-binding protein [Caldilineaceae bacterium]
MESQPIIVVDKATKIFQSERGPVHALNDFDMVVHTGEFVSLVGPSGCGKSTLLWAMAALWPLSAGSIKINGEEVTGPRREVGMVFQSANLLPWRNLMKNIYFPLEIMGERPRRYQDRIDNLLEMTALTGFEHHYPGELSGGMQQRASIVRALSYDPQVLLMDEPFGALDAFTRDEMNVMLLNIWEAAQKTIVFVTHQIPEAVYLSDRVYVMTPRPGRNLKEYKIDLPRPRPLSITTESRFFEIVGDIKNTIYQGVQKATEEGAYEIEQFAHE